MSNKLYLFIGLMKKAGAISSGNELVEADIKKNKCKLLIISEDASENTKKKFLDIAESKKVPCICFGEKDKLGQILGIAERAVVAILDNGFANGFIEKYKNAYGGDLIGKED